MKSRESLFQITFHEIVEAAPVPCGCLVGQHLADDGFILRLGEGGMASRSRKPRISGDLLMGMFLG